MSTRTDLETLTKFSRAIEFFLSTDQIDAAINGSEDLIRSAKASGIAPEHQASFFNLYGRVLMASNNPRARVALEKAVELDDSSNENLISLAIFYQKTNRFRLSSNVLQELFDRGVRNAGLHFVQGLNFLGLDRKKYAKIEFYNALLQNPEDMGSLTRLSSLGAPNGLINDAIRFIEKNLDRNGGTDYRVYQFIGYFYLKNEKMKKAERYAQKALKLNPEDTESMRYLSIISNKRGDFEDAKVLLERAVKIAPKPLYFNELGKTLNMINKDDGLNELLKAANMSPENPNFKVDLGMFHYYAGKFGLTIHYFKEAIALEKPRMRSEWHYLLGLSYLKSQIKSKKYDREIFNKAEAALQTAANFIHEPDSDFFLGVAMIIMHERHGLMFMKAAYEKDPTVARELKWIKKLPLPESAKKEIIEFDIYVKQKNLLSMSGYVREGRPEDPYSLKNLSGREYTSIAKSRLAQMRKGDRRGTQY